MQIPQLTFTRFIASISIVILHFGLSAWPFNEATLSPIFSRSVAGISFFFALSGFILVVSMTKFSGEKIQKKQFWLRRAARILPIYWFSLLLFFFLRFDYDSSTSIIWQLQPYGFSTLLLQSWHPGLVLDVNFPAWSLSVEALFYLLFPFLFSVFSRFTNKSIIFFSLILWISNSVLFYALKTNAIHENFSHYFPVFHLATFAIGVFSGILFVRNIDWIREKGKTLIFLTTLICFISLLISAYFDASFYRYQHNGLLTPFFVFSFISISILSGSVKNILASRPLIFLGEISYSIYILQLPIFLFVRKYIPLTEGSVSINFFIYLLILIICSAFTYRFIEKPARRLILKKFS